MSAENKNIEKLFASKFEGFRHDLDVDGAWKAVESELEQKKKRRFFWWIWPIGAMAIAAIAFFVFGSLSGVEDNQDKDSNKLTAVVTQTENLSKNATHPSDDHTRSMNTSDKNVVRPQAKDALASSASTTSTHAAKNKKKSSVSSKSIPESMAYVKDVDKTSRIDQATKSDNVLETMDHRASFNPVASKQTKKNTSQNFNGEKPQAKSSRNGFVLNNKKSSSQSLALDHITFSPATSNVIESSDENKNKVGSLAQVSEEQSSPALAQLVLLPISIFQTDASLPTAGLVFEKSTVFSDKQKGRNLFVELYGGGLYNFIDTRLTTSSDQGAVDYLDRWNETQSALGGYQFGVKIGKTIWKRFELSTGLNFQKVVNKIEWRKHVSSSLGIVWDDAAFYHIDEQGNRLTSGGQLVETRITSRFVKAKQTHHFINIPIQVGYSTLLKKYSIGLHVGPVINLSHLFEGWIVDESYDIRVLTTDNYDDVYRTSVGLSGLADLRLGRSIGNFWEVTSTLSFLYNGNNVFRDDFLIDMSSHQLSFNFGLRKYIN